MTPTTLATAFPVALATDLATDLDTNLATNLATDLATHLATNIATNYTLNLNTNHTTNLASDLTINLTTATATVDGGDAGREGLGGGLQAEDIAAAVGLAAYCRGLLLYDVKIFLWEGNRQGHTSSHTLVMVEVSRHTFGWGWQLSLKLVVCK
jgi:hypothetical protein